MKTKKMLLRFFLNLIDATEDYQKCHGVIGDKEFIPSLIKSNRIDEEYLTYAIYDLMDVANLSPSAKSKAWEALPNNLPTIKQVVREVYKHQV